MYIKTQLKEDRATGHPFWSAQVIQNGNIVLEVVSKTFQPFNDYMFERYYNDVSHSVLKELKKIKDKEIVKHLLINNANEPQNS